MDGHLPLRVILRFSDIFSLFIARAVPEEAKKAMAELLSSSPGDDKDDMARAWDVFNALDVNGDNSLTLSELQGLGGIDKKRAQELFLSADTNGDRSISFDEFLQGMRTLWSDDPAAVAARKELSENRKADALAWMGSDDAKERAAAHEARQAEMKRLAEEAAATSPSVAASWEAADKTLTATTPPKAPVAPTERGWTIVRVFVSSTFADMHAEREVLIKEVFAEARIWCNKHQIRLVECDLRWGVPKETTTKEILQTCLAEVDRCRAESGQPYFLNMLSERYGWVPSVDDVPNEIRLAYQWIPGFSVTAMEIMHASYRTLNPRSIYFIRDPSFKDDIPEEHKRGFIDTDDLAVAQLGELKKRIRDRFPASVFDYEVTVKGVDHNNKVELDGLMGKDSFAEKALSWLMGLLHEQFPADPTPPSPAEMENRGHRTFVEAHSGKVYGRDKEVKKICEYVSSGGSEPTAPLVVVGPPGSGKSTVLAKAATEVMKAAEKEANHKVIYHFIGSAPGSTSIVKMLVRMWRELGQEANRPDTIDDILGSFSLLMNLANGEDNSGKVTVFIDALNQLDEEYDAHDLKWLPVEPPAGVRIIIGTLEGKALVNLRKRAPAPQELVVGDLNVLAGALMVADQLANYNKRLDDGQLQLLMGKDDAAVPLYLSTAVDELRVFGIFEKVTSYIEGFKETLELIMVQSIERVESENELELIRATLCLLECSRNGLLESELLELLADSGNLMPPTGDEQVDIPDAPPAEEQKDAAPAGGDSTADAIRASAMEDDKKAAEEKLKREKAQATGGDAGAPKADGGKKDKKDAKNDLEIAKSAQKPRLAMAQWSNVLRSLYHFFRASGISDEGRLDFNNISTSKAIRQKYLSSSDVRAWWHGRLAGYFETSQDEERRTEELPYALEKALDSNKLVRVLVEWSLFDGYMKTDTGVIDLLRYWRAAGGYELASAAYAEALDALNKAEAAGNGDGPEVLLTRTLAVGRFLGFAGQFESAIAALDQALALAEKNDKDSVAAARLHISLCHNWAMWADGFTTHEGQAPRREKQKHHGERAEAILEAKRAAGELAAEDLVLLGEAKVTISGASGMMSHPTDPTFYANLVSDKAEEAAAIFKECGSPLILKAEQAVACGLCTKAIATNNGAVFAGKSAIDLFLDAFAIFEKVDKDYMRLNGQPSYFIADHTATCGTYQGWAGNGLPYNWVEKAIFWKRKALVHAFMAFGKDHPCTRRQVGDLKGYKGLKSQADLDTLLKGNNKGRDRIDLASYP